MKYKKIIVSLSLGLSAMGCKKDDDKNPSVNGESAQDQVYVDAVDGTPKLLVVYGDSLSTGVLSNTTLGKNIDNSLGLQLVDYLKDQEFNASGFQSNLSNPDIAAATTKETYGIRSSFGAADGVDAPNVGVVSFAKFGGKAQDLPHMFARWQDEEASTVKRKPDYIFVMLGGNDFCSDNTVEAIVKDFTEQTAAIHQNAPDAKIVIAPAPPIDQLAAIDHDYGTALGDLGGENLSCKTFRQKLCKRIYDDPTAVKTRATAINAGIQAAATSLTASGAKVVYVDSILSWQIQPDELAVDCFHPSALGQQTIGNFVKAALAK